MLALLLLTLGLAAVQAQDAVNTRPNITPLGDQLYMAVCFWYLVKPNLSSERYCTVMYTSVTFKRCQNNTAMFIWL